MKTGIRSICFFLTITILIASCTSTTMIQSNPPKAKVYLDGAFVGETPYLHRDSKIVGSSMVVKLEKEGYNPFVTTITKDEEVNVGAIIGGLFVLVPFLWTMQYQPSHNYNLIVTLVTFFNSVNCISSKITTYVCLIRDRTDFWK